MGRINLVNLKKVVMPEMQVLVAEFVKISWRKLLIKMTCDVLVLASDFKDSTPRSKILKKGSIHGRPV